VRLFRRGESASTLDLLVAGLGNPGPRHERDRHNVGFMVVDELGRRHDATFKAKFNGRVAEVRLDRLRIALLKPETYMNESGRAVQAAVRFYKLPPERLLAVNDEVDLEPGRLQARMGGGLAGHNGLRSIARHLGTQEFLRLRVGVGRPERGDPRPVADYVLSPFAPEDDAGEIVTRAADAVETSHAKGLDAAGTLQLRRGAVVAAGPIGGAADPAPGLPRSVERRCCDRGPQSGTESSAAAPVGLGLFFASSRATR
jgi:PTH1 family peptidyl-tRNA hydrolase